jgi:succinate---hydroxymethylglutarate CoA-transferase
MPELFADRRFATQLDRARNQNALAEILEAEFRKRPAAEWLAEMDRRGVPCSPINSYPEVFADPHVQSMGLVRPLRLPNGIDTQTTAFPVKMTGYEFEVARPPPGLGDHTDEVIAEWLGKTASAPEP